MSKTRIAIAMIVRNEEEVIERCLRSAMQVTKNILVLDTGSADRTVDIVRGLGIAVEHFTWIDDFSAARNASFDAARRLFDPEYILWIDADDIIEAEDARIIVDTAENGDAPCYVAKYVYHRDNYGQPAIELMRERMIKASDDHKWEGIIHEAITIKEATFSPFKIVHMRPQNRTPNERNLRIYDKAASHGTDNWKARDLCYYARELKDSGRDAESLAMYKKHVSHPDAWWEDKALAYCAMARLVMRDNPEQAREYAVLSMSLKPALAEAYCMAGESYLVEKKWEQAAHWYEVALTTRPPKNELGALSLQFYTWWPHVQLCMCYSALGMMDKARYHNTKAKEYRPNDPNMIYNHMVLHSKSGEGKRLNLGCGSKRMEGYVNCDLFPGPTVDEAFSLDDIPYADGTVEALHSEHALEHLPRQRAEIAIKEWARVLKPGGELLLKVPDLELCCKAFLDSSEEQRYGWWHHTIYGIQVGQAHEPDEGQIHYCGFTKERLRRLLEEAGFIIDFMTNYDGWGTPSIYVRALRKIEDAPSVGWLVPNNNEHATIRIRALNVNRWLRSKGIDSNIITREDLKVKKYDAIVTGKLWSHEDVDAINVYRARTNSVVIADLSEDYFSLNVETLPAVMRQSDLVVTCSRKLAEKVEGAPAIVIEDAVESAQELNCVYRESDENTRLKAGWLGYGGNAYNAEALIPILDSLGYDLVTIHEWPNATIKWDINTCFNDLAKCDIAIAPQNFSAQPCKSNNKLTQAMALGLPTVASPLQAYVDVVASGNAIIASSESEWADALRALRDSGLRKKMGDAARATAENFRLDAIGKRWLEAITETKKKKENSLPVVDIIIPTYNNSELLTECLKSIDASTDEKYRVLIVDSGEHKADHNSLRVELKRKNCTDYIVVSPERRVTFSEANNIALSMAIAPYICLLNDDTIATPGWITEMKKAVDEGVGIVGPFSNCDQGWLHNEKISVSGVNLHPGMKLEQVKGIIPSLYDYGRARSQGPGKNQQHPWVAFYCVLMKNETAKRVGVLDEIFRNGGEDVDYCYRATRLGFTCAVRNNAFVFHFGGTTRKNIESEDYNVYHKEDKENHTMLASKWGKKTIAFFSGPALEPWSPTSISKGGIGGSETALIHMAKELSRHYRVVVFNDCQDKAGVYDGVEYIRYQDFPAVCDRNYFDVFISSREIGIFAMPIRSGKNICWVHDIWLSSNPKLPECQNKVDAFLCLSNWHKSYFCEHHGIDPGRVSITRNGLDMSRFMLYSHERDRYRFIYSSSPDRGLDVLLDLWPEIRKAEPRANLRVFYGFDNWEKMIERNGSTDQIRFRDEIKSKLNQPGVTVFGRVDQYRLAQEMSMAGIWAYPAHFWETFCITALEAQASGLAIVTSALAGLTDSVKAGILIGYDGKHISHANSWAAVHSQQYKEDFLSAVIRVLREDDVARSLSGSGRAASLSSSWGDETRDSSFAWEDVAASWRTRFLP